jgi:hypothetical protein
MAKNEETSEIILIILLIIGVLSGVVTALISYDRGCEETHKRVNSIDINGTTYIQCNPYGNTYEVIENNTIVTKKDYSNSYVTELKPASPVFHFFAGYGMLSWIIFISLCIYAMVK